MNDISPAQHPAVPAPNLSYLEALALVLAQSALVVQQPLPTEHLPLADCPGRVLAAPILADRDQPPFDRATRDGYALRAEDLKAATSGAQLRLIGQLRAGEAWPAYRGALAAGEAVEIMTGAPLPAGANAVLMVEHAEVDAFSSQLHPAEGRTLLSGANVVSRASEAHQGDVLASPGTRIGASQTAVAASCGLSRLPVYAQPRVVILATGDELVEPQDSHVPIAEHQIFNSNSHSITAQLHLAGAIPLRLPIARDQRESLTSSIRTALDPDTGADLLLISGGVSMGKFDLVKEVLSSFGAEFIFTGVRIQPGKPLVFGKIPAGNSSALPARYFFGLPGNPISTMVTFALFVRPLLAALTGDRHWQPSFVMARLHQDLRHPAGLTRFLPAWLDRSPASNQAGTSLAEPTVTPVPWQGSGDLAASARANAYIIVPEEQSFLAAGSYVRILLLNS